MKKTILIMLLVIPILWGCAETRRWTLKQSKENLKNAEVSRTVAKEMMSTWSLNSGAIQCGFSEILPIPISADLKRMDKLVKDAGMWSDEDYRYGCFEGLGLKLTGKAIDQLVKEIMGMIATYAR